MLWIRSCQFRGCGSRYLFCQSQTLSPGISFVSIVVVVGAAAAVLVHPGASIGYFVVATAAVLTTVTVLLLSGVIPILILLGGQTPDCPAEHTGIFATSLFICTPHTCFAPGKCYGGTFPRAQCSPWLIAPAVTTSLIQAWLSVPKESFPGLLSSVSKPLQLYPVFFSQGYCGQCWHWCGQFFLLWCNDEWDDLLVSEMHLILSWCSCDYRGRRWTLPYNSLDRISTLWVILICFILWPECNSLPAPRVGFIGSLVSQLHHPRICS